MYVRDLEIEKIFCRDDKFISNFLNLDRNIEKGRKRIVLVSKYDSATAKGVFLIEVFSRFKNKNNLCIRSFLIKKDYSRLDFVNEVYITDFYLHNYLDKKKKNFISCFYIDFDVSSSKSLNSLLFNKKNKLENIIKVFM
jgi:hypothetical protein